MTDIRRRCVADMPKSRWPRSLLEPDKAAPHGGGYGFGPVAGVEFLENVLYVHFDGAFGPPDPCGDLGIAEPLRQQREDLRFTRGQRNAGSMLGELGGNGVRYAAPAAVHG